MPTRETPTYRCTVCGADYPPHEAVRLGYHCHGQPLSRITAMPPLGNPDNERAELFHTGGQTPALVEIVPAACNDVDAGALSNLLGSLNLGIPFSLEIAGNCHGRRMLLRADPAALPALVAQIEGVYGQATIVPVMARDDPARSVIGKDGKPLAVAQATMHLRRSHALPLRTFRDGDLQSADPMLALLGAFARLGEDEHALSQLVLSPAPSGWADRFAILARPPEQYIRVVSPLGLAGGSLLALGLGAGLLVGLRILTWLLTGRVLPAFLLTGAAAPLGYLAMRLVLPYLDLHWDVDPQMVREKIFQPAFTFRLRLQAQAPTPVQAERLLARLIAAYNQFSTGAGNALTADLGATFVPFSLNGADEIPGWERLWGLLPPPRQDIISAGEAATLWHLPVSSVGTTGKATRASGTVPQMMQRTLAPRRLPRPEDVAEGAYIGTSSHQGQVIPICLPPSAMERNRLLVARTQRGKTTLMIHLALYAMKAGKAVVFIDPHGDAVRALLGLIPPQRVDDVVYVDFGDPGHVTGWNLLDVRQGFSDDVIVDAFVAAGRQMWSDFWGPRMEDVLRAVVRTLLVANRYIVSHPDLGKEYQYTVLDIAPALMLQDFQQRLRVYIQEHPDLLMWWYGYFDEMLHHAQRLEVVNPVMSKINRLYSALSVRRAIGLPCGSLNLWDVVRERRIMLVNLPGGTIGTDNAAFLGSFVLSYLETVVRAQQELPRQERPRVSFFLDECASIPYDYQNLLAELVKMGADFTLSPQSLHQLDAVQPGLAEMVLANVDTLAVFQVSGADARRLVVELGDEVTTAELVDQPDHTCSVKTQKDGRPLPVMTVDVAPLPTANQAVEAGIERRRTGYTVTAAEADRRYEEHVLHYYRRPLEAFLEQMQTWATRALREMEAEKIAAYSIEEWLRERRVPEEAAYPMRVAGALPVVRPVQQGSEKRGKPNRRKRAR